MNHTRALPTDLAGEQKAGSMSVSISGLQVSKSALNFDQTNPGEESFLTLKITPPVQNTLVVVSVKHPALFQVAVGVERLAFKQVLTFKPTLNGTYIHLRYTPEHTGRHQSLLLIEAPATGETLSLPLLGHTGGFAALALPSIQLLPGSEPIVRRPTRRLLTSLLIGSLLIGSGYAGYVYRCQIWPGACSPFGTTTASATKQKVADQRPGPVRPALTRPKSTPIKAESESVSDRTETRSASLSEERTPPDSRSAETANKREKSRKAELEVVHNKRLESDNEEPTRTVSAKSEALTDVPTRKSPDRPSSESEDKVDRKSSAKSKPTPVQRTQSATTSPKPKPVTKPNPSEESELERVLNRESN